MRYRRSVGSMSCRGIRQKRAIRATILEPMMIGAPSGHDMRRADVLPLVSRHLNPLAALEFRHFVHLRLIDRHLAVLVADPKIDVVYLIPGADHTKIGAGKVMAVVELPHRLVGVDEL